MRRLRVWGVWKTRKVGIYHVLCWRYVPLFVEKVPNRVYANGKLVKWSCFLIFGYFLWNETRKGKEENLGFV
ncbi:hypothetical protein BLD50_02660 [Bacillus cereus]|nr:hypothetical protein BLD50_07995 [Bacillus cereus]OLR27262.1 hypothetical protein BLD50_02660 [Bacillus cereus]